MKADSTIVIIMLIIISFTTFTRSLVYAIFDNNLEYINKKMHVNFSKTLDKVFLLFSILRIILASIILNQRGIHQDMLTYDLIYLIFASLQRFYYEYLIETNNNSKMKKYLQDYQPANSVLIVLSSIYIMKYVFFP